MGVGWKQVANHSRDQSTTQELVMDGTDLTSTQRMDKHGNGSLGMNQRRKPRL